MIKDSAQKHSKLILLLTSLALSLLIAEALVRILGRYDADGNFFLGDCHLQPYAMPIEKTSEQIKQHFKSSTYDIYDPDLGWTHRPGAISNHGFYSTNLAGIRTSSPDITFSKTPPAGVLRIALFGDSFTYGSNVPYENTWGYYLENNLKQCGLNTEVLNFGVGAYGMDQAYLRWVKLGR